MCRDDGTVNPWLSVLGVVLSDKFSREFGDLAGTRGSKPLRLAFVLALGKQKLSPYPSIRDHTPA